MDSSTASNYFFDQNTGFYLKPLNPVDFLKPVDLNPSTTGTYNQSESSNDSETSDQQSNENYTSSEQGDIDEVPYLDQMDNSTDAVPSATTNINLTIEHYDNWNRIKAQIDPIINYSFNNLQLTELDKEILSLTALITISSIKEGCTTITKLNRGRFFILTPREQEVNTF